MAARYQQPAIKIDRGIKENKRRPRRPRSARRKAHQTHCACEWI